MPPSLLPPVQLVEEDEGMKEMSAELEHLKQAANMQASSLAADRHSTPAVLPVNTPAASSAAPPYLQPCPPAACCLLVPCPCPAPPAAGCPQGPDRRGAAGPAPDQHRGGAGGQEPRPGGLRQPPLQRDDGGVPCRGGAGVPGAGGGLGGAGSAWSGRFLLLPADLHAIFGSSAKPSPHPPAPSHPKTTHSPTTHAHTHAHVTSAAPLVQALEKRMYEELCEATEYFGEEYAPADATRVLRTVRDFVVLFEKGLADIRVGLDVQNAQGGLGGFEAQLWMTCHVGQKHARLVAQSGCDDAAGCCCCATSCPDRLPAGWWRRRGRRRLPRRRRRLASGRASRLPSRHGAPRTLSRQQTPCTSCSCASRGPAARGRRPALQRMQRSRQQALQEQAQQQRPRPH